MSLFGKAQKTKTTVKPSAEVESLLRNVVSQTQNMPAAEFISKQYAGLNPQQQQAIANLAGSSDQRNAAALLSGRLSEGLNQLSQNNQNYTDLMNRNISAGDINQAKAALQRGTNARQLQQGINGVSSQLRGDASVRLGARNNANLLSARNRLNPQLTNLVTRNALADQQARLGAVGQMGNIAEHNVSLGQQGVGIQGQAIQNQLNAGNINQANQQAQNQINYENANAQALFPWQQLQNKLNILNSVSPMAGYTTTTKGAAPSTGQQITGAAMTGLGIYGNLGGFSGFGDKTQTGQVGTGANAIPVYKYDNQIYNNAPGGGTGILNRIGGLFS